MRTQRLFALVLCAGAAAQSPDAIHYKLELDLDFTTQSIQGTTTATFASTSPAMQSLSLDLSSSLTVAAVEMNGAAVAFTRPTDRIDVALDGTYGIGQTFSVKVTYGGVPPSSSGFGGLSFVTTPGGRPCAWTLSEPWDASTWWPGKDELDDKATFEIWITHPTTMGAVSNGLLQGLDILPNNRTRSRWQTDYPMAAYLASFVVTEWSRRTDTYTGFGANMPIEFFVFPESLGSWTAGMDRVVPMLTALSGAFGQYPFVDEKYGIAQFTWSGGMEHQTISSQASVSESLTAHELAHQWWGDMITCETWSDVWLNEGFATFSEAIWLERKTGGTLADYLAAMIARKPSSTAGTVYVYSPTSVANIFSTTNVYRKGAWALHMLRGVLGDAAFFQALLAYRAAYQGDSATTTEFKNAVEQSSGRELDWFFEQWVMTGGSPAYRFAWQSRTFAGSHFLHLELDQTQTSQSVFTMPVRVRVTTA
jgi:aminopeptidase N